MTVATPAAARALAVFEAFARHRRAMGNGELARELALPASSCSDLLSTLVDAGYLARVGDSRKLYPTGRLLEIAHDIDLQDDLIDATLRMCSTLRDHTRESTMAGRIEAGSVKVLAFCEGSYPLRYTAMPGNRLGVHVSAIGKAILMQRSAAEAERVFTLKPRRALAAGTITDVPALMQQLEQFRRQGYAHVENEGGDDLAAMAMAGHIDGVQVAVSLIGPVNRLRINLAAYLSALRHAAQALQ